jgi:hypothetical protein
MDRIMDVQPQTVSREVRPVERLRPSKPLSADGGRPYQPPYGVVDRVTLSPEGRAMAMQQRTAQPAPAPQRLIYGPGRLSATFTPRLPYEPEP